jgi:hypothetical protein
MLVDQNSAMASSELAPAATAQALLTEPERAALNLPERAECASARSPTLEVRAEAEARKLDVQAEAAEFDDPEKATQLYRRAERLRQGRLAPAATEVQASESESEHESDDGDWPSNDDGE